MPIGTHHKRDKDTFSQTLPHKQIFRKKKARTTQGAQMTHIAQSKITDFVYVPSQIMVDVAPANVESQPQLSHLQIKTVQSNSPNLFFDVNMIITLKADSPSFKLIEEPHSETGAHHLLDDLLEHQSFFFGTMS